MAFAPLFMPACKVRSFSLNKNYKQVEGTVDFITMYSKRSAARDPRSGTATFMLKLDTSRVRHDVPYD